jgi:2-deoxy-D-gluconate 3-dehydrogenase
MKPTEIRLDGKVAVITGGNGGIGFATAELLGAAGAKVFLTGRRADSLQDAIERLRGKGVECRGVALGLDGAAAASELAARAAESFGHVDILVNSAGINRPQRSVDVTEANWDAVHAINLKSLFFVSQAIGRDMVARRSGSIVNVSSQAGSVALPLRAAYCSSKGGVDQLTRTLALEWAPHGVRVNAVAPTFVETPFVTEMFKDAAFKRFVLDSIPLGRMAQVDEVAAAVLFLVSDWAGIITGHVLMVDGGWTIQ